MEHVLLVIQVLLAIALIAIILIQRSDSDGFGLGSGSGANLLSGRATANLLTRTTAILAGLFMFNALLLSVLAAHNRPASIVDTIQQEQSTVPIVPSVPAAGAEKAPAAIVPVATPKKTPVAPAMQADKKPEVAPAAISVPPVTAPGVAPAEAVKKPVVKRAAVPAEEAPSAPADAGTND